MNSWATSTEELPLAISCSTPWQSFRHCLFRRLNRFWRRLQGFTLAGTDLELLDRLNPTIAELSQAVEREVEKCPEAQRLATHPGVGALTAMAFVLIIGEAERFQCGK
jgi:transposase